MPELRRASPILAFAALVLAGAATANEPVRKSNYLLDNTVCGSGNTSYPKLPIGMRDGYCAGLVASKDDGLRFPRSIVQIPGRDLFVVSDMGGWNTKDGRLLVLDPSAKDGHRIREAIVGLDYPFGLAVGPDHKVYASTAETIFRFDPLAPNPTASVELIIKDLPGRRTVLSDGTRIEESSHSLKQFVFDRTGRIFVNIGSHNDGCVTTAPISKPCAAGEGASPLASIWMFTPPSAGVFPSLKAGDSNPKRDVFARGLRNSMALAIHPRFPDLGFAFLQGENGRDLPDILKPNEELNAIEQGKHYGWPYCYDISTPSPEFVNVLAAPGPYKGLCLNRNVYKPPLSLLPPHGAPLGMLYYNEGKLPGLKGKLIVALHGYRPTGSRLLAYEVDSKGFPRVAPAPVRYNLSCGPEPSRAFQANSVDVPAAPYEELISSWHKVNGVRPQGAPVGMAVARDGSIWLVEDKNQTVIRIDATERAPAPQLPCDSRSEKVIDQLATFVTTDPLNRSRLTATRTGLIEKHCVGCHSDFGLKPGQSGTEKDVAVLKFMLSQDGWVYPGDPDAGKLRTRLRGFGAGRLMPPGGENLPRSEDGYLRLLDRVDYLVGKMVPGTRMRIRSGVVERKFENKNGKECGRIPVEKVVIVLEASAKGKTSFSKFYRPADIYLNGECNDEDGYYILQRNLVSL